MADKVYTNFQEFWPFYLSEHRKERTRNLHILATGVGGLFALLGVLSLNLFLILLAAAVVFGAGHYVHEKIEQNKPSTYAYPLWNLQADGKLFWLFVTGKLEEELVKQGIKGPITN